jgi:hypothetical protein
LLAPRDRSSVRLSIPSCAMRQVFDCGNFVESGFSHGPRLDRTEVACTSVQTFLDVAAQTESLSTRLAKLGGSTGRLASSAAIHPSLPRSAPRIHRGQGLRPTFPLSRPVRLSYWFYTLSGVRARNGPQYECSRCGHVERQLDLDCDEGRTSGECREVERNAHSALSDP